MNPPSRHPATASPAPATGPALDAAPRPVGQGRHGRPLAAVLLASAVAALAAGVDRLMVTWADEHLLAVWIALWAVVFAGCLALAGTFQRMRLRWGSTRRTSSPTPSSPPPRP